MISGAGAHYVRATNVRPVPAGLEIDIDSSGGAGQLHSPLIGDFNVDNLLTVLAVLMGWDVPLAAACAALARCPAPPGRMQAEGGIESPLVLIDYAHTPDALAKALTAARAHCRGKLWCVFGCGGERDHGKRSEMGRIAAALADRVVITDESPRRGSAPDRRCDHAGHRGRWRQCPTVVIHNRAAAISHALEHAGAPMWCWWRKGHEDYQLIGTERRAFNDAAVVRQVLAGSAGP